MAALSEALARGVLPAARLTAELDVSPATLMRRLRDAGPNVVSIGRGRATRYGLRQPWPGLETTRFPLFRVDAGGRARSTGELVTLAARESVLLPDGLVSSGLPIKLADARPSGFLGRHFAATHAELRLPPRLDDWSDHHILLAETSDRAGHDLAG